MILLRRLASRAGRLPAAVVSVTLGHMQRTAVVTGASSGIGAATARLLATKGWHCILVARREDRLRLLAAEIGGEVEVCDVGDREAVEALAVRVLEHHPTLHLLVNNAGIPARPPLDQVDLDLVEEVARVNYLGGVWMTRSLLPGLRSAAATGKSDIVNVVSIAGAVAFAPSGAYIAAKHAQLAFSRSLRATLRGSGVRVHTILPGYVQTDGFPQQALLDHRVLRHIVVQPERVAAAIVKSAGRGSSERTVPWFPYRPAIVLYGIAPGLVSKLGSRLVRKSAAFQAKSADRPPDPA
jgi:short-subunit dehydrogenase